MAQVNYHVLSISFGRDLMGHLRGKLLGTAHWTVLADNAEGYKTV